MLALALLISCAANADMTVEIQATLGERILNKTVVFNAEAITQVIEDNGIRYSLTATEQADTSVNFKLEVVTIATEEVVSVPEIRADFNQEATVKFATSESTDELTVTLVAQKLATTDETTTQETA